MGCYKFKIEKFMEVFKKISGYSESDYAYWLAKKSADYIVKDYMDCPSEYYFTKSALEFAVKRLVEVFDILDEEARYAFEKKENHFEMEE